MTSQSKTIIRFTSLSFILLLLYSCASPGTKQPPLKQTQPISVVNLERIETIESFSKTEENTLFMSQEGSFWWKAMPQMSISWELVEKVRAFINNKEFMGDGLSKNLAQLRDAPFMFSEKESHQFKQIEAKKKAEKIKRRQASLPSREEVLTQILFWSFLILLLTLFWRGGRLIQLFFALWKKSKSEELHAEKLYGKSSLVPPLSLLLLSSGKGTDLVAQIKSIEALDFHELELIVFRNEKKKDDDALSLKDYQLRYRSPLYFSDLKTEDPLEILEVKGKRRILIVYTKKAEEKNMKLVIKLFLKLARYPLIGVLNESFKLNESSLYKLVYHWLKKGDKEMSVLGFIQHPSKNPFKKLANLIIEEFALLGAFKCNLLLMIKQNRVFGLFPKQKAVDVFSDKSKAANLISKMKLTHHYVGESVPTKGYLKSLVKFLFVLPGGIVKTLMTGFSLGFKGLIKFPFLDYFSVLFLYIFWPLISLFMIVFLIMDVISVDVTAQLFQSYLLLFVCEVMLIALVYLISELFLAGKFQSLFVNPTVESHRKQKGI